MKPIPTASWKLVAVTVVIFAASTTGGYYTTSTFGDVESGNATIQAGTNFGTPNTSTLPATPNGTTNKNISNIGNISQDVSNNTTQRSVSESQSSIGTPNETVDKINSNNSTTSVDHNTSRANTDQTSGGSPKPNTEQTPEESSETSTEQTSGESMASN